MGFRFQKRFSILPGVRLNLSKSGLSTSLGPRGADVNIGRNGVTTNAGIPGTGISYRSKLGGAKGKSGGIGVLAVVAGLSFWAFQHMGKIEKFFAGHAPAQAVSQPVAPQAMQQPVAAAPQSTVAQPAAAVSGVVRYVHRGGSDLRETPKASGKVLKKEAKGATVTLLSEGGGWAQVTDGNITGWMRSSVLGEAPPK